MRGCGRGVESDGANISATYTSAYALLTLVLSSNRRAHPLEGALTYTPPYGFVAKDFYQDMNIRRGRALAIMVDHWRWHRRTRVPHGAQLTATTCLLIACVLFATLPATAAASAPEMRGEWKIVVKSGAEAVEGKAIVNKEADGQGKFESLPVQFLGGDTGTFSGTLEGGTATVKTTLAPIGPFEGAEFFSTTIAVEVGVNSLALSGEGTITLEKGSKKSGTLVATRIRTYKQIEEQEAKEKEELEEREARTNVRGEWALTLEAGPQKIKGIALISEQANATNEFASKSALFEGFIGGTFTGKLKGGEAEVTITTEEVPGSIPAGAFTSKTIAVSSKSNPTSMSGTGTFTVGTAKATGTLTATRIRTYQQIQEQEKSEREAREKKEKEAQEAAEKLAREHAEAVAREQSERELKERQAREAAEKAAKIPPPSPQPTNTILTAVEPVAKTFTLGHGGTISLGLTNPNASPVHGHLKLTLTKAGKSASAKHSTGSSTLGESSFTIVAHGTEVVKVKLSPGGRTQLARHKTLRVLVTVTTQAGGHPDATKSYTITLHAAKPAHRKH
jgi:hypothetical protein